MGETLTEYFKGWGSCDGGEAEKMAGILSQKAIFEQRRIQVKWIGDHYMYFNPDGTVDRTEHEGQEDEFQKYEEVADIWQTI